MKVKIGNSIVSLLLVSGSVRSIVTNDLAKLILDHSDEGRSKVVKREQKKNKQLLKRTGEPTGHLSSSNRMQQLVHMIPVHMLSSFFTQL